MKKLITSCINSACKKARKLTALVCLAALIPFAAGCFGTFQLTRSVYEVNENVSESTIVQTLVMWVFAIIPVYGFAVLGDLIIFNVLEFFSGGDTVITSTTLDDGTLVTFAPTDDDNVATLTAVRDGETLSAHRFVRCGNGVVEVFNAAGDLVGTSRTNVDGAVELIGPNGAVQSLLPAGSFSPTAG